MKEENMFNSLKNINDNHLEMDKPITADCEEILKLIPHRYPMLLIDRVKNIILNQSAVGIKNVSMNEEFFQGHFPSKPIMPGVLIIEAMAQTAAVLVVKSLQAHSTQTQSSNRLVYFMSVEEAKFRKPVVPGDQLELKVTKIKERGLIWKFKGEAYVDNQLTDEAIFTAMIVDENSK